MNILPWDWGVCVVIGYTLVIIMTTGATGPKCGGKAHHDGKCYDTGRIGSWKDYLYHTLRITKYWRSLLKRTWS